MACENPNLALQLWTDILVTPSWTSPRLLKILQVIPGIAPLYGGPSQAVIELSTSLIAAGVQTEIATTDANGSARLAVDLEKPMAYKGVQTHFFCRHLGDSIKYSRPMANWLSLHVSDFDAVHIHGIFSHQTLSASHACIRSKVPYVIRPMGMLDPWSMNQKPLRKFLAWHLLIKQCLRKAAVIQYTCEEERLNAERSFGLTHGFVIPNGVRTDLLEAPPATSMRGKKNIPLEAPYVLTLSRIHPKKGFELLLDGFSDYLKGIQCPNLHLVIAGEGDPDYVKALHAQAQGLGIEAYVHWTGWLEGEEKRGAMQDANLFVLPSFQENFGIAAVEAMACGIPVLVSRQVGLAHEIEVANSGWVIDLSRDELCMALREAASKAGERAVRGKAGRELVRWRFTWSTVSRAMIEMYENILLSK